MRLTHLFTTALGLTAPWEVTDVRFDPEAGRIDLDVAFAKGSRFACPDGAVWPLFFIGHELTPVCHLFHNE